MVEVSNTSIQLLVLSVLDGHVSNLPAEAQYIAEYTNLFTSLISSSEYDFSSEDLAMAGSLFDDQVQYVAGSIMLLVAFLSLVSVLISNDSSESLLHASGSKDLSEDDAHTMFSRLVLLVDVISVVMYDILFHSGYASDEIVQLQAYLNSELQGGIATFLSGEKAVIVPSDHFQSMNSLIS